MLIVAGSIDSFICKYRLHRCHFWIKYKVLRQSTFNISLRILTVSTVYDYVPPNNDGTSCCMLSRNLNYSLLLWMRYVAFLGFYRASTFQIFQGSMPPDPTSFVLLILFTSSHPPPSLPDRKSLLTVLWRRHKPMFFSLISCVVFDWSLTSSLKG